MTAEWIWISKGLNCRYELNVHSIIFSAAKFDSLSIISNVIVLYTRNYIEYRQNTPYPNVQWTDLNE